MIVLDRDPVPRQGMAVFPGLVLQASIPRASVIVDPMRPHNACPEVLHQLVQETVTVQQ